MIKIKSKNVDVAKLDKIQEEFQAVESELPKLKCDGTEDSIKKIQRRTQQHHGQATWN